MKDSRKSTLSAVDVDLCDRPSLTPSKSVYSGFIHTMSFAASWACTIGQAEIYRPSPSLRYTLLLCCIISTFHLG